VPDRPEMSKWNSQLDISEQVMQVLASGRVTPVSLRGSLSSGDSDIYSDIDIGVDVSGWTTPSSPETLYRQCGTASTFTSTIGQLPATEQYVIAFPSEGGSGSSGTWTYPAWPPLHYPTLNRKRRLERPTRAPDQVVGDSCQVSAAWYGARESARLRTKVFGLGLGTEDVYFRPLAGVGS